MTVVENIYTAALDARPVESLNVVNTMLQHLASYPGRIAYHCVVVTLGQAGHMRELFHVIDTMRSPPKKKLYIGVYTKWDPRLEPDIIVYNSVLNACVRQKNLEGAFWILQQLKELGKQPNSITYGLAMEVMLACEKYDLVHEFFQKMRKSFIPNSLTYKEGKVDEAIQTFQYMEKRGIVGFSVVYYHLARCLCSVGRCKEALVQVSIQQGNSLDELFTCKYILICNIHNLYAVSAL
ncbi:Pentatricopeptide repeat-containing protein [Artemisia annua]|uniref:Pentatricopeptide repeat-containing protein n=1 Tax=Artemisia annua TaxID=35608 RepID=A0A2U1LWX7_ARTAN|nr:Pentatricopeptide repeat-containing protein [Artemisia annua]